MELSQLFDLSLQHTPYNTADEHLYDSLKLLDLHIICALEGAPLQTQDAWTYVNDRIMATLNQEEDGCILPLYTIAHRFDLNSFSYFCTLTALGPCIHDKYGDVYARLNDGRKAPDLRLAQQLYALGLPLEQDTVSACLAPNSPCRILLGVASPKTPSAALDTVLTLNPAVYAHILELPLINPYYEQAVRFRHPMEDSFFPQAAPIKTFSPFVTQIAEGLFQTLYDDSSEEPVKSILLLGNAPSPAIQSLHDLPASINTIDPANALNEAERAFCWGSGANHVLEAAAQLCNVKVLYLNWDLAVQFDYQIRTLLLSMVIIEALLCPCLVCLTGALFELEDAVRFLLSYLNILVLIPS